jgi:hypothetical protein
MRMHHTKKLLHSKENGHHTQEAAHRMEETFAISISLVIKELQIETTLRFHLTPVRMGIFNNTNNKCW